MSLGLLVAGLVVFLIGDNRRAFESKDVFYAVFDDVQGLARGSPVRMGGVDIGQVVAVGYGDDLRESRLRVTMDIVRSEAKRIREDSTATIGNKGLLGDKMIVIKVGSPDKKALGSGSTIRSEVPTDLGAMFDRLGAIGEKAEVVVTNLQKTTETLADPELRENLKTTVHSLSNILKSVDEGDGYVSRLLKDPKEADRISHAMQNMDQATAHLSHVLQSADATVARVNNGPGFAHDMIYGQGPTEAISRIGHAAEELAVTLEGIRKGNGLAHSLIYGGDGQTQDLIANLNGIAADARKIVSDVRAGKGTVGALLVDPSVYEDLKLLLGNVERNKTLRALVRYSIQKDEKVPSVEIKDPSMSAPSATENASVSASGK